MTASGPCELVGEDATPEVKAEEVPTGSNSNSSRRRGSLLPALAGPATGYAGQVWLVLLRLAKHWRRQLAAPRPVPSQEPPDGALRTGMAPAASSAGEVWPVERDGDTRQGRRSTYNG